MSDAKVPTPEEFVKQVATEHPMVGTAFQTNECKFCQQSWAEDSYEEFKENEEILGSNPDSRNPVTSNRLKWEHHDEDCVWIIANRILEDMNV